MLGVPSTPRSLAALAVVALTMLGLSFAAQVFQEEEDLARGDRTFVASWGPRGAVDAVRLCLALSTGGALAMAVAGWIPRVCLLGLPVVVALHVHLAQWRRDPASGGKMAAMRAFWLLVAFGLVLVGAALGDLVWSSMRGMPVSGLGTAVVPRW